MNLVFFVVQIQLSKRMQTKKRFPVMAGQALLIVIDSGISGDGFLHL
jgi:hypothetical protein